LPIGDSLIGKFDVVTDYGTTEHVDRNFYQTNKNIHDMVKVGGLVIRETPLTGHWKGHGSNYLDEQFYKDLATLNEYEILDLKIEYAMGNTHSGGLVCVVYKKTLPNKFISQENWEKLKVYNS